jgi:lipopolysaccharide export system protein LptA
MKIVNLICLLGLLLSHQALSKTSDNEQPIHVEADSLEVRENDNISIYVGNVKLTQGSLEIRSDRLTLYFDDDKTLTLMKMTGSPATLRQLNDSNVLITGEAMKMEYRESESLILLFDKAKLTQGEDIIESNKIYFNTANNTIEAGGTEPENRVQMLIQPKQPSN